MSGVSLVGPQLLLPSLGNILCITLEGVTLYPLLQEREYCPVSLARTIVIYLHCSTLLPPSLALAGPLLT